jgi:hypothetical protein
MSRPRASRFILHTLGRGSHPLASRCRQIRTASGYSVPKTYGHRDALVRGYVHEAVFSDLKKSMDENVSGTPKFTAIDFIGFSCTAIFQDAPGSV